MKLYDCTMTVDEALSTAMDALRLASDWAKISGTGSVIPKFEESKAILNAIRKSRVEQRSCACPQWLVGSMVEHISDNLDPIDD